MATSKRLLMSLLATAIVGVPHGSPAGEDPTAILLRQTRELLDAVGTGDRSPWQRYVDARASYLDEDGVLLSKAELLSQIKPLPPGVSGTIEVVDFRVHVHGDTAVATHEEHETEVYFGQTLHARYRTTHVWVRTKDGWQLVSAQVIALLKAPPATVLHKLDEYIGTYDLTPKIQYEVRRNGNVLTGQRTGRSLQTLKAELSDVFFVPEELRIRKIFLRGSDGHITGFADRREGQDVVWKKRALGK